MMKMMNNTLSNLFVFQWIMLKTVINIYEAVLWKLEKLIKKFLLQNDKFFTQGVEIFWKHVF